MDFFAHCGRCTHRLVMAMTSSHPWSKDYKRKAWARIYTHGCTPKYAHVFLPQLADDEGAWQILLCNKLLPVLLVHHALGIQDIKLIEFKPCSDTQNLFTYECRSFFPRTVDSFLIQNIHKKHCWTFRCHRTKHKWNIKPIFRSERKTRTSFGQRFRTFPQAGDNLRQTAVAPSVSWPTRGLGSLTRDDFVTPRWTAAKGETQRLAFNYNWSLMLAKEIISRSFFSE